MNQESLKAYVEKTLLYLEKDWEWSPILLEALTKGDLDDVMISAIAKMLSDAIASCQDDKKREYLIHAQGVLTEYQNQEQESIDREKVESENIIRSLI